jgi:hypothetical protein
MGSLDYEISPGTEEIPLEDVEITVGGFLYKAHSLHLRALSRYFGAVCRARPPTTSGLTRFEIAERSCEFEVVYPFLDVARVAPLEECVEAANVAVLLRWGDKYIIPKLTAYSDSYLEKEIRDRRSETAGCAMPSASFCRFCKCCHLRLAFKYSLPRYWHALDEVVKGRALATDSEETAAFWRLNAPWLVGALLAELCAPAPGQSAPALSSEDASLFQYLWKTAWEHLYVQNCGTLEAHLCLSTPCFGAWRSCTASSASAFVDEKVASTGAVEGGSHCGGDSGAFDGPSLRSTRQLSSSYLEEAFPGASLWIPLVVWSLLLSGGAVECERPMNAWNVWNSSPWGAGCAANVPDLPDFEALAESSTREDASPAGDSFARRGCSDDASLNAYAFHV